MNTTQEMTTTNQVQAVSSEVSISENAATLAQEPVIYRTFIVNPVAVQKEDAEVFQVCYDLCVIKPLIDWVMMSGYHWMSEKQQQEFMQTGDLLSTLTPALLTLQGQQKFFKGEAQPLPLKPNKPSQNKKPQPSSQSPKLITGKKSNLAQLKFSKEEGLTLTASAKYFEDNAKKWKTAFTKYGVTCKFRSFNDNRKQLLDFNGMTEECYAPLVNAYGVNCPATWADCLAMMASAQEEVTQEPSNDNQDNHSESDQPEPTPEVTHVTQEEIAVDESQLNNLVKFLNQKKRGKKYEWTRLAKTKEVNVDKVRIKAVSGLSVIIPIIAKAFLLGIISEIPGIKQEELTIFGI